MPQSFQQLNSPIPLSPTKLTTFQHNLHQLIPPLPALLLTFFSISFLKKKLTPILIILSLFLLPVLPHLIPL
ncbi:PTS system mannose/fructose/sorbose family transporter subunit IID, partial [Bacillus thuringiensis]|uniref:PTS system mannose/fructose/sorbose family transporter subunit IID n=1 Tax=Bacillus thuringiensis TaxID=1428 RepID=UPI003BFA69B3